MRKGSTQTRPIPAAVSASRPRRASAIKSKSSANGFFTEDFSDFEVQLGQESFYDLIDLAPCEKDRCQPALRPIRSLPPCL